MSVEIVPREQANEVDDCIQNREALITHVEDIRDALTQPAFERFIHMSPERHNILMTTAYAQHEGDLDGYKQQVLGAYIDFFTAGTDVELSSMRYDVCPLDVESLATNMPQYLAVMEQYILRAETGLGEVATRDVVVEVKSPQIECAEDSVLPDDSSNLDDDQPTVVDLDVIVIAAPKRSVPNLVPPEGIHGSDRADEPDMSWQDKGLCAQTDPEAFFPERGESTKDAKRICLGCEVKDECLQYALDNDERFGVWGGMSERERRRLKRGII